MATTRKVIFTYTCDLCGTEQPGDSLRRFGLVPVTESDPAMSGQASARPEETKIKGSPVDVCLACRERPITELLGALERHEGHVGRVVIHVDPEDRRKLPQPTKPRSTAEFLMPVLLFRPADK